MRYLLIKVSPDKSVLRVYGRGEDYSKGFFTDTDFRPYFYVPDPAGEYLGYDGERLTKVYAQEPGQVPQLRLTYERHYEADIPYADRYMIDRELYSGFEAEGGKIVPCEPPDVKPRTVILDIEVATSGGLPSVKRAEQPVSVICIWDSYTEKFLTLHHFWEGKETRGDWVLYGFKDERAMLSSLHLLWRKLQPDILTGWYVIGGEFEAVGFDVPYLQNRLRNLRLGRLSFEGTQVIDAMYCFRRMLRASSWKLKDVARQEGYPLRYETFEEVADDPEALLEYNKQDVDIVRWLEEKYKAVEFHWNLKCLVGINRLSDTLSNMRLIDVLYLRRARADGVILPSKSKQGVRESPIRGAIVFQPVRGVHEWVASFDFSRYYPSIILTLNLSPEGRGIFPSIVKDLLELRAEIEGRMKMYEPGSTEYRILESKSNAVKFITNSLYGVLGNVHFRLYRREIAEKITETARMGLMAVRGFVEGLGYNVLYGDTDSVLVKLKSNNREDCLREGLELQDRLNSYIDGWFRETFDVEDVYVRLKFERLFSRILFTGAKKRYAGRVVWEKGKECDYTLYRGFEIVRTDQSLFTKRLQDRVIELILDGAGKEELRRFLREFLEEFKRAPLEEIAISKTIGKSLDSYRSVPPHVRGAVYSNTHLGTNFKGGDSVMMVWVKGVKGLPPTDVICFDHASPSRNSPRSRWTGNG